MWRPQGAVITARLRTVQCTYRAVPTSEVCVLLRFRMATRSCLCLSTTPPLKTFSRTRPPPAAAGTPCSAVAASAAVELTSRRTPVPLAAAAAAAAAGTTIPTSPTGQRSFHRRRPSRSSRWLRRLLPTPRQTRRQDRPGVPGEKR